MYSLHQLLLGTHEFDEFYSYIILYKFNINPYSSCEVRIINESLTLPFFVFDIIFDINIFIIYESILKYFYFKSI